MSLEEKYFEDYESPERKWGYIDKDGNQVIEPIYDAILPFQNGIAAVNYRGKWGYIDDSGKKIIEPAFLFATSFSEGKAIAQAFDGKFGLIDKEGNWVVDPQFDNLQESGSFYVFTSKSSKGALDKAGREIISPNYDHIKAIDVSTLIKKDRYGWTISNADGQQISETVFEHFLEESEGLCPCGNDGLWGYCSLIGKTIIPLQYDIAETFQFGLAPVLKEGKYFLINIDGEKVSEEYEFIHWLEGRWGAQSEGLWTILDTNGKPASTRKFDAIYSFSEGLAPYLEGDSWGYIDTSGIEIIPPVFYIPWPFKEGVARVLTYDGMQFIDKTGRILPIEGKEEYRDFHEGRAAFQED